MENKYGLMMNSFERNVVQVALTHLYETHEYLITEEENNPSGRILSKNHQDIMKACEEMLNSLK